MDSEDYGTFAQVIATLFVALAIEVAAVAISSNRNPDKPLSKWLDIVLAVLVGGAIAVLISDLLSMVDMQPEWGLTGTQLICANVTVIVLMGFAIIIAPLLRSYM